MGIKELPTRRGDYIVNWRPEHPTFLIQFEGLAPGELVLRDRDGMKNLVRDLFHLGFQDDMANEVNNDGAESAISRVARQLLRIGGIRHRWGCWSAPAW